MPPKLIASPDGTADPSSTVLAFIGSPTRGIQMRNLERTDDRAAITNAAAHAPGRVELLGNHTDYNEGVVLGAAIDRGISVAGKRCDDAAIRIRSPEFGEVALSLSQAAPLTENRWANYALGVVRELIDAGAPIAGFEANISSDLPIGGGLSSSAAFELATALFLLKIFPCQIPLLEIAKACQRAEHRYVGVRSGLLDQVISLFGRVDHAVFFDVRSEEIRTIPFPSGFSLLIAESGTTRNLGASEYNLRRQQTHAAARALGVRALRDVTSVELARRSDLPDLLRRRAAHVVGENERVWQGVEMLQCGDAVGFGRLMNASHDSSRRYFENSTPELDALAAIAQGLPGVLGARLTGAGFGGAVVILCQEERATMVSAELSRIYSETSKREINVFSCRIAEGAV